MTRPRSELKPVPLNAKAELACAMRRPGFKAAWDELEEEYVALNELLQARVTFHHANH